MSYYLTAWLPMLPVGVMIQQQKDAQLLSLSGGGNEVEISLSIWTPK